MAHLFDKNAEQLGVTYRDHIKDVKSASTDMGNVSYEVPSIHPGFHIGSDVGNHTRGFTAVAGIYMEYYVQQHMFIKHL